MTEQNEFDNIGIDDEVPEAEFSETPDTENMISSGSSGQVYDWNSAPEGVKAPPRTDLDGQIVTLIKGELILPAASRPWEPTKAGDKFFKYCTFALHYDKEGQQEFYSGVRVFKREEHGQDKYSHPTFTKDRKNQASRLMGLYADYKKKDINEVSLKEFMAFLNSKPKARIKAQEVTNPQTEATVKKNFIGEFVGEDAK